MKFKTYDEKIFWILLPCFLTATLSYIDDVRERSFARTWITEISDNKKSVYIVKYSPLGRDTIILRIYGCCNDKLLAERIFQYPEKPKFYWFDDALLYHTNDPSLIHNGRIKLPPTLVDNLLARLP